VKQFVWEPAARADLRRIDRDTARRILLSVTEFGRTGHGDAKKLTDREGLYRLRIGKWRLFFDLDTPDTVRIHGIDNRGEAC
jgi:mRNA interferase RelE/StbE